MNVLVCGASGCIGNAVCDALAWRGHRVIRGVRQPAATGDSVAVDFMRRMAPREWAERLREHRIDAVVNAVGILQQHDPESRFDRIHRDGPLELFAGARLAGATRIVQVSALGEIDSAYLRSKRDADDALLEDDALDAAVVRPSLVYGPRSESGRLFATLAALPVIGLPGRGEQRLQPVHVFEVAEAIASLVERTGSVRGVYELGGGDVVSYRAMLERYRVSQGLAGPAIFVRLPMTLMLLAARVAEWLPQRVLSRDTIALLASGNVASRNAGPVLLGRTPSTLAEGLAATPPEPLVSTRVELPPAALWPLRATVAMLWLYTAAISALLPHDSGVLDLLARCGFSGNAGTAALVFSCALNATLGWLTLTRPGVHLYAVQCAAILGYTLTAALHWPQLTIDHCGPLAKNLPLAAGVLVLWLAEATGQTSMLATRRALPSMKLRRGSTSSPISIVKTRSASIASSS